MTKEDVKHWVCEIHIPHGSADAEYHIVDDRSGMVIAIIDPHGVLRQPEKVADAIVQTMRTYGEYVL